MMNSQRWQFFVSLQGFLMGLALFLSQASAHELRDQPGHGHSASMNHEAVTHENGIGPDPDGDTNPATNTRIVPFMAQAYLDRETKHPVIYFEPPPGDHGDNITNEFADAYGVRFGPGLSWQICDGQRHNRYDSMCTYAAPTSGNYAAGYVDYLNRPLSITFDQPVCFITMSIYPTGAEKDEEFEFAIEAWRADGRLIERAKEVFQWQEETVRFENLAGAYFPDSAATKVTVSLKSLTEERRLNRKNKRATKKQMPDPLRYIIDDLSFVSEGCADAVSEVEEKSALELSDETYRVNRQENKN